MGVLVVPQGASTAKFWTVMNYAVFVNSATEDGVAEHSGSEIPVIEAIPRVHWIARQMMAQVADDHDLWDF
jgi:hypothetical protein